MWPLRELLVVTAISALMALMIVVAGQTMSRTSAGAPDETFVINPDDQEPFIVCTERAGDRHCAYLDLNPAQP